MSLGLDRALRRDVRAELARVRKKLLIR